MQLLHAWAHTHSAGFVQRGWHSEPSGKPVLHFIHGNGFCGRVYDALLKPLTAHFDLFLSDVQGHGDTDHGGRFHGWNRTADLCAEAWLAHRERFGEVVVYGVGHSFGGVMTSLMLARQPDLFARAVLLDPVLFSPKMIGLMALSDVVGLWRLNSMASRARKRRAHWPDRDSAWEYFHERGMFKGWSPDSLNAYLDHALHLAADGSLSLKCKPSREAEIFGSFPRRLWASLARITTPVHIVHGVRSYPFVAESVARWQSFAPHVTAEQVPGGHCFMLEHPAETAERVLNALAGSAQPMRRRA